MNVKPANLWSKRWVEAQGTVPGRYKDGVQANDNWHNQAMAGQNLYQQQMTNPEVLRRRETGLGKVSQDKWKTRAMNKGATNIVAGMKASEGDYMAAASKSSSALAGTPLPERSADPYSNLMNRGGATIRALRQAWGKE